MGRPSRAPGTREFVDRSSVEETVSADTGEEPCTF
jgi:hypothetical protein